MSELLLSLLILEIMIKCSFRRLDNSTQPPLITSSFFFFFLFFRIVGVRRCLSLEWVKGNSNFRMLRRAIWFRQGNQMSGSDLPFLPPPHNNTWEVLSIVYLLDQHFEPPSGVLGVPSTLPTLINVNIFDILAISPKILCKYFSSWNSKVSTKHKSKLSKSHFWSNDPREIKQLDLNRLR